MKWNVVRFKCCEICSKNKEEYWKNIIKFFIEIHCSY